MRREWIVGALAVSVALAGCRVERHGDGASERVQVETPVGSVKVKTNAAAEAIGTGLPVYPGATPVPKKDGDDAADVDMHLGELRLRVKAVSYRTGDAPADVETFYRKAMRGYGAVIACRDDRPVGQPERTDEGLSCGKGKGKAQVNVDAGTLELRAGSPEHRHIVGIEGEGAGTKFALVVLDLPKGMSGGDDSD